MPASWHRITWDHESQQGGAVQVVRHRLAPGGGWSEHDHDYAEVFWVESGGGIHRVDGVDYDLRAGDVWCLRPEHVHTSRAGRLGLTVVNVSFPPAAVADLARRYRAVWPWRRGADPRSHLPPPRMERLHGWAHELAAHKRAIDLDSFLLDLTRLLGDSTATTEIVPPWLRDALEAFRDPRHLAAGTNRLAHLCGRTDDHLNRVLRRCHGRTTTDLVTELRMDHAAGELRLGERPIATIAAAVGLPNLGHFYRCFHKRFGTTPKRYRRSARQVVSLR